MTPAVFIPGTLCDARVFSRMLERLDLTAIHAPPIDQDDVVDAADAVLAISPPRFVAVGFSLGGFVVLELIRRAADRLIGAVLIASHAHPPQADMAATRRAEVAAARETGMESLIEQLWPRYVATASIGDTALKQLVINMAQNVGPDRFGRQAELAIRRPDSRGTVTASALPMLIICGLQDAMLPPGRCRELAARPNAVLAELPDVGHLVPLEAPAAAADAINGWVRDLTPCC